VRGFFKVLLLDGAFFSTRMVSISASMTFNSGRTGHRGDAGLGASLVHDVDGLVRQEA
jgi:hypothetical protein